MDYPVWLTRDDVAQGKDTVVEMAVRGIGNRPPMAMIAAAPATECTGPDGADVRLDGSSSSDPDSAAGTHDDIAIFEWFEDFGEAAQTSLGAGEVLQSRLAPGSRRITLRVKDRFRETAEADAVVDVVDTTPPAIQVELTPSLLWPPDHRLVPVQAVVTATDRCGESRVILASVSSDQPDDGTGLGDGNTANDIQNASPGQEDFDFLFRAERGCAHGSRGRTYRVAYTALDDSGNAASAHSEVHAPAN